jgi:hypothetical protein
MATGGTIDLCSVCENSLEEEKSILKCSGVCEFTCYLECSTLKKAEHKVLENTNFAWFCDKCKIIGPNINRLIISLEHAVISCQNEILKQSTTINNQNREIKKLTDEVKGLKEHLKIKQAESNMQGMTPMSLLKNYNQKKDEENQSLDDESINSSQNNQGSLNKTTYSQAVKKPTKEIEERDSGDSGQKNKKKPVNNIQTNEKNTFNSNKQPQITGETDHLHNKKNHYRKQTVIGQKSIENNDFKGADKKVWLFISKTSPNTTEEIVLQYLQKEIPNTKFSCEKIPTTNSTFPCFKVGAPFKFKEELNDPSFWPTGVAVRRYTFKKQTSFLEKPPQNIKVQG